MAYFDFFEEDNLEEKKPDTELEDEELDDSSEESEESESNEEEPVVTTEAVDDNDDDFSFTPFVKSLVDSDILSIDPEKDYDDSEEGFEEVIQHTVNTRLQKTIESLDPKFKRVLELGLKGVSIDELIKQETDVDYNEVDLEDTDNQILLIEEHLLAQGYEEEDIKSRIEKLQDMGELDKEAKVAQKYLIKKQTKEKSEFESRELKRLEDEKLKSDKEVKEFKETILSKKEIGGFKVSKPDLEKLYDYITKPVKKDKDGKVYTQQELDYQNKDLELAAAYYAMNKFNFKDLETKIETKKTIQLKKAASKYSDSNGKNKSGLTVTQPKENIKINSSFFNYTPSED